MRLLLAFFCCVGCLDARGVTINTFMTGVDEANGNALLAEDAADTNWDITAITASDGTVPRDATVTVSTAGGWTAPLSGTRIITRGTSYDGVNGTYSYTYTFNINTATHNTFAVSGQAWADDQVRVLLNGNEIMALSGVIWNQPHVNFSTANQSYFVNGANSLTFQVLNSGGGPTGLNVSGIVTALVPEPGEWAMLICASLLAGYFYRERMRSQLLELAPASVR